jgi:hypothetical protein
MAIFTESLNAGIRASVAKIRSPSPHRHPQLSGTLRLARLGRLAWCYDRQYADADKVLFYGARTYCFHDLDLIKIQKIIKCETSTRGA